MKVHRSFWLLAIIFHSITVVAADRPNVLLIVTDDQGYGDMSCHGNPMVQTPHLDRFASESARLDDYHVDPVCTPTRASLMTGRYSTRVGAWAVTEGRQLLDADEVTMAEVFANSGYRTAMFGKWHLGDTWPFAPRFRGFQQVVRHLAGGIDEIGNPIENDYFDDTYYRNGKPERIDGYCTDVYFDECERFIKQSSDKPFFVYLPLNAMHSPHTVAEKYSAPFSATGHGDKRAKFYGQIVNFDENLGRLLQTLDEEKLADNTIVIFMGDNGSAFGGVDPDSGKEFNAGMRGMKGFVFEGGHRVACFVRWPQRLIEQHRVEQLTSCRDWLPTLIEWCDLEPPHEIEFDGKSLAPLLEGTAHNWPERTFFVERQADQPKLGSPVARPAQYPQYAVLTEHWRMVNGQLYDIVDDPGQKQNVASQNPVVVQALQASYEQYFTDVFSDHGLCSRFQLGTVHENPICLTVRDWHPTEGNVIWMQDQLGDDALQINGFWAINVVESGRYSIRLTRFPDDAPQAMRASVAKLRIGELLLQDNISREDESVTFEIDLSQGHALLQTWLSDEQSGDRGAYFVHVERLTE